MIHKIEKFWTTPDGNHFKDKQKAVEHNRNTFEKCVREFEHVYKSWPGSHSWATDNIELFRLLVESHDLMGEGDANLKQGVVEKWITSDGEIHFTKEEALIWLDRLFSEAVLEFSEEIASYASSLKSKYAKENIGDLKRICALYDELNEVAP